MFPRDGGGVVACRLKGPPGARVWTLRIADGEMHPDKA